LFKCSKVWLRTDRVRKPLEAPYTGPYNVIRRSEKHFIIEMPNNIHNTVSIDRLKPFKESIIPHNHVNKNNASIKKNVNLKNTEIVKHSNVTDNFECKTIDNNLNNSKTTSKVSKYGRKIVFRDKPDYINYF